MVSRFQDDPLTGYLAALAKAPVDDDTRRVLPTAEDRERAVNSIPSDR